MWIDLIEFGVVHFGLSFGLRQFPVTLLERKGFSIDVVADKFRSDVADRSDGFQASLGSSRTRAWGRASGIGVSSFPLRLEQRQSGAGF